ncbi:MAG: flagellar filament capping protein FliD [Synergistales bacterium]
MADFQISGLSSGIDWGSIIDKVIESRRQPETAWREQQQKLADRESLYSELAVYYGDLKESLSGLKLESTFLKKEVQVTPTGDSARFPQPALEAEASPLAEIGRCDIEVLSLARASRVAGSRVQDAEAALGKTGSFSLSIGDFSAEVSVNPGQNLSGLAEGINEAVRREAADRGVSVPVTVIVLDNTLVLRAESTGKDFRIGAGDPDGILADLGVLSGEGTFAHVLQEPADAVLTVDGLEVTRSSNAIGDLLQGVKIELCSTGSVRLDVSLDAGEAVEAVGSAVEAYNATLDWINKRLVEETVEDPQSALERQRGLLRGDSLLWTGKSSLREAVMLSSAAADGAPSLFELGIRTESSDFGKSGKLEFDESAFMEMMKTDPEAVAETLNAFASRLTALAGGMVSKSTVSVGGVSTREGRIPQRIDSLERQSERIDLRVKDLEARLILQKASLEALYANMETSLSKMTQQSGMLSVLSSGLSSTSYGSSGSGSSSD